MKKNTKVNYSEIDEYINRYFCKKEEKINNINYDIYLFRNILLNLISQKEIIDLSICKNSEIDRKMLLKILNDDTLKIDKNTIFRLCIGLQLTIEECQKLLMSVGYNISFNVKKDVIFYYFIINKIYSIELINKALMNYDQEII